MKSNVVLVDFENIQPKNIGLLSGASFRIKVFVGTNQAKVPLEMARVLQMFGPNAEYIQISGSGRNALDFHIAYYLGRLAAEEPDAQLHVISKDKGFDPLIKYLNAQKIICHRWTSIADIPLTRTAKAKPGRDPVDLVIENLEKRRASKPRTLKTLRSTINARFGNLLTEAELDKIIDELSKRQVIRMAAGKISYETAS